MNKITKGLIAIVFLTMVESVGAVSTMLAEKVSFNKEISADATPIVLSRILKAKEQPISEISFEKGTYHFYPEKGLETFTRISNHGSWLVTTAFPINGLKNLIIDGQGSTFIFHGRMIPFMVDQSDNIKIKNVTIDWEVPFNSEGLVVANNVEKKTFDIQISNKYPYEIRNGQLIFVKENYEHTIGQSILFDPAKVGVAFQTEDYTSLTTKTKTSVQSNIKSIAYKYPVDPRSPEQSRIGSQDKLIAEQLKPGIVRISNHTKKLPPVGLILIMKGDQSVNRVAPAIRINDTKNFVAENVTINHAGGMGFLAENSENVTLDNLTITPSNGRMVSTTADATHFVGCRGKVTIKNSKFQNMLDDGVNVHGAYQVVQDILSDNSIGVKMGHFQQQEFTIARTNDTLGIVRLADSFFADNKLTVKSIDKRNGRYQIITFNEKLPVDLKPGDYVENLSAYPEVLVQNTIISKNRARGLLLSTPKKTIVENCTFGTEMEAILLAVESGFWYESGSVQDLTIRNNTFNDCQISGFDRGVIRFETDDESHHIAFKNIKIENNTFNQFDNLILEIKNTDGLEFTGNTIKNSGSHPILYSNNPAITVSTSKNIVFNKSEYLGKAKVIVKSDDQAKKLVFK